MPCPFWRQLLYKLIKNMYLLMSSFISSEKTQNCAFTNLLKPSKAKSEIIGHFLIEWKKRFISVLKWSSFFKRHFKDFLSDTTRRSLDAVCWGSSRVFYFQLKCKLVTIGRSHQLLKKTMIPLVRTRSRRLWKHHMTLLINFYKK